MNRTRLERLLAMLEAFARAAKPKPRTVLTIADWSHGAVDAAVARRQADLDEHQVPGGLLVVPADLSAEAWEAAQSDPARVAHDRPEHAGTRE